MSSTIMMERTGTSLPSMGMPGLGTTPSASTGITPTNMMMVPRCTLKMEKCQGGCRITCSCDDKMACSMVQNLCSMLTGGLCTCCVMYNGMPVCTCNLTMGLCKCEMTDSGMCLTCTSGDSQCCEMIQACCDCMCCMMDAGCTCCVMINNTPVCCGCCETGKSSSKSKSSR
ncbi:MAG: hypothetical protein FJ271_28355 [Planctomycetes bacterium]|nr:hypothetical protein [Planctomycetota bacterium]